MATVNKNLSVYDKQCLKRNIFVLGSLFEWNEAITEGLYNGAEQAFFKTRFPEHIIRWNVPGSFELIYGCKKCFKTQNVDAVIAIGSVIQGNQTF
jgi:6,7-dimethyl-8-ribityllumazine synthase